MLWLIIGLSLVVIILITLLLVSYKFFRIACYKDDKTFVKLFEKAGMNAKSRVDLDGVEWLKSQDTEDIFIDSEDGIKLHATYLPVEKACRTIICIHGYRGNAKYDFSPIVEYLHSIKSNLLLIDQRCTGKSLGKYITYGAKEKKDVVSWVKYVEENLDKKNPIYLYGISMGATTALLSLEYDLGSKVKGVVADCGYASMKNECCFLLKKLYLLPTFPIINLLNVFCNVKADFDIMETDTTNSLLKNKKPILFIHGEKDTFVVPDNTKLNFDRTTCSDKDILWVKNANHGESFVKNKEKYQDKLEDFFDKK